MIGILVLICRMPPVPRSFEKWLSYLVIALTCLSACAGAQRPAASA